MTQFDPLRRLVVEAIGTALLLATVIGSGIMGETLSPGNDGIALLGNTIATGAILVVLILTTSSTTSPHCSRIPGPLGQPGPLEISEMDLH